MTQLIVAANMNPSNGFVPTDDENLEAGTHVMVRQMTNHDVGSARCTRAA